MKFLYKKYPAKKGEVIEVELSAPAAVKFMTAAEFRNYAGGRTHTYYKGRIEDGLIRLRLPFDSVWHAVVEKGDAGLTARAKLCPPPPEPARIGSDEDRPEMMDVDQELQSLSLGSQSEG